MNNRTIISLVLTALVAFGWVKQITSLSNRNRVYQEKISMAETYQEKRLYQKAIAQYDAAISLKDDVTVRNRWLEAHRQGFEDGVVTGKEFGKAYLNACEAFPQEVVYWEELLELYLSMENYSAGYSILGKLERSGAKSEKLTELSNDIRYSYLISRKIMKEVYTSPSGITAAYDGYTWGAIGNDGERVYEFEYRFISPFNAEGEALFVTEKDARIIGQDKIVSAIINKDISRTRAPSEGIIPVQEMNNTWRYLNCDTGEFLSGIYEDAASFQDGVAAVLCDQQWYFINLNEEIVSDVVFEDIKIHPNGEYIYKNKMVASVNGQYGVYDRKGKLEYVLPGKNADVYRGDYIAYQDDSGQWGFVNKKGEIVLSPQFDEARSFSNGLAAIRQADKWGYINRTGDWVIDPLFLEADYFSNEGVAFISSVAGEYTRIKLRFGCV